jgi:hypothetical protein
LAQGPATFAGDVLEPVLGAGFLVHVRVVAAGELTVGPLDVLRTGVARDAEYLVVVPMALLHLAIFKITGRRTSREIKFGHSTRSIRP